MVIREERKNYIDQNEGIIYPSEIFDSNGNIIINNVEVQNGFDVYTLQMYFNDNLSNFKLLEILIKLIYKKYPNKDYVFFGEHLFSVGEFRISDRALKTIKQIKDILKNLGSNQKITFVTNNYSASSIFNKEDIKYSEIIFFIGKSYIEKNVDINLNKRFTHTFLYKNGEMRPHRKKLFDSLKYNIPKFENHFLWSYNTYDKNAEGFKSIEGHEISHGELYRVLEVSDLYNKAFCNIISETTQDEIFITEKLDKPLLALQPFIVHGACGYLKKIKELGFKTFDRWWDESYDDIQDNNERINKISEEIVKISQWGLDKCQSVYAEMKDILLHNQELRNWITNNHQHQGTYSEIEYIKEKWKK